MATVSQLLRDLGALYDVTTTTTNGDPFNKQVQFEDDANFVASGDTTLIFSGPPILWQPGGQNAFPNYLVPIGAVQGFSDSEQNGIVPFPEVGSRLKRTGRTQASYQVNISRVQTFHSNLRHALYAWIARLDGTDSKDVEVRFLPGQQNDTPTSHFTNFESDLMAVPFGLLLATATAGGHIVCKEYYERCNLLNAGKTISAAGPIIQEQVSIMAIRKRPADGLAINLTPNGGLQTFTITNPPPNFQPDT